ncbi:serine/threonine-protein kinase RsbW [Streptomyces achromogenes]|uniref:Serine/threonine-protein kinase RsbW n=1 Tax=Streptomyces achromogenes TaxID=67255 RepID=A0ABU0Q3P4_STRAH|nr:ATP-binding protein [Streptomyces achromogenes]MDQ0685284.1 serine/threonine-protein kinase RsbW [Streptomyces achromogenes]
MPKSWCRMFPGLAWQVAQARHFVAALLEGEAADLVDSAVLVVGELAANAVRHTRSGWYRGWFLVVVHFGDDLVRIEVVDQGGDEEPLVRSVARHVEEGGRGLMMIASCAKDWGVKDRPAGGRCVWAELSRNGA